MFALILALLCAPAGAVRHLIRLDVSVDDSAGRVEFGMAREDETGPEMEVHRRIQGGGLPGNWEWRATLPREVSTWSDTGLDEGVVYEYRFLVPVDPDFPHETAAYVSCGIRAPLVDSRGRVLLVVDETIAGSLSGELQRFGMDLVGDGWVVERLDFGRHGSASPEALRAAIQASHAANPLSSIILFGRLPIVLSGLIRPDEHSLYRQATDLYYADIDGTWPDLLSTNDPEEQNHYPGDGNLDPESVPGPNHRIEIPIGRIDLAGMTAWREGEVALLRRYLDKNHHFRHCLHRVPREGYFTSMAYDESPLEAAAVVAMLGPERCVEAYDQGQTEQSRPFLWGIAGRDWNGSNYPGYRFKSHFTVNFASGKQAWDWDNNAMRAMLAMPWYGLTCTWGVRPNWLFHFAGMGGTLGYCNFRTVNNNNNNTSPALPPDHVPGDDFDDWLDGFVHINLMGDPTLRIHPVPPVRDPQAAREGQGVRLSWRAPDDWRVTGFHVYRSALPHGPYSRLTPEPIGKPEFHDPAAPGGRVTYMVRPVKVEEVPGGSYMNAGQGTFFEIDGAAVNRPPTPVDLHFNMPVDGRLGFTPVTTDPDGDPLTLAPAAPPLSGSLNIEEAEWVYEPDPGFSGIDRIPVSGWDGSAGSVGMVTVRVGTASPPPPADYPSWQAGIPWQGRESSPLADPDDDNLCNELEFLLARDPLVPDGSWHSRLVIENEGRGDFVVLEFKRRRNQSRLLMKCSTRGLPWWSTVVPDGREITMDVVPGALPEQPEAELIRARFRLGSSWGQRLFRLELGD